MAGRAGRVARRIAFTLAAIVLVVAFAFGIGALVPRPLFVDAQTPPVDTGPARRILLLANPIHTDIALPVDADVLDRFGFLREDGLPVDHPAAEWLVFGWGGRAFYLETPTWSELKVGPVARALTLDGAVMHVSITGRIPEGVEGVRALDLDPARFERLLSGIEASFTRGATGDVQAISGRSYGDYDRFYEAAGWFNVLIGCNVWTARVLRGAGVRTGWWNPLPQSLLWSIDRYNEPEQAPL
ncbi:TIGR02117 family protein [Mesorhizobium sp. CAU 1732]|uniref:TIGR02117 family protein n=1 Tax=Mesorhizobium sp. CAU 1732 TaxID=3140358 RepID=UPI0032615F71